MESIRLSPRLNAILQLIPTKAQCLADIGSDHAYLPCRAVQEGRAVSAIAGEVRPGPYRRSVAHIKALGLHKQVDARLGDGLDVLHRRDEADVVVIAGMGGELIANILQRGRPKLGRDTLLILQPNNRESHVRQWLNNHGWAIIHEKIVAEPPHFYEMIVARQSTGSKKLTERELLFGPVLSVSRQAAFIRKWEKKRRQVYRILHALRQAGQTGDIRKKRAACMHELMLIRACVHKQSGRKDRYGRLYIG